MSVLNQIGRGILAGMLSVTMLAGWAAVGVQAAEEMIPEDTYIVAEEDVSPAEVPEEVVSETPEEPTAEEPAQTPQDVPEEIPTETPEATEVPEIILPEAAVSEAVSAPAEDPADADYDLWDDPLYYRMQNANDGIMTIASGKTYGSFTTRTLQAGETLHKGIDVSVFQGNINWQKVADSGVEFVFIRVAYRGTGTGSLNTDSMYKTNLAGAKAAGLKVGAYIFSQAISESEARAEARYLMNLVSGYTIDMPLVIDFEFSGNPGRLKAANLSRQKATDVCNAFCDEVESAGYDGLVYANYSMLSSNMYADQLSRVWLAHFASSTGYSGAYEYWQCTDSGTVSGISGYVDLDFWFQSDNSGAPKPGQSKPGTSSEKTQFTDVTTSNWYYDSVMKAYEKGIVKGMTDTTFSPTTTANRGQVVTMVYRMEGEPATASTASFTDLTADYYKDAIAWAAANNVVNGYPDNRFAPGDSITREDLVTILYRLAGSPSTSKTLDGYTDASSVHSYARTAMAWAVEKGVVTGYTDNTIRPTNSATRAEVCTILMRYMELAG